MSTDIFISYRRSDREAAERLGQCLGKRGLSHWYDGMIGPGQDWRDEIVENIKLAKILIILFSEAVNESTELKKELSVADDSQTIILVVRIENVKPKDGYAYELSNRNWFDAFDNLSSQLDEFASIVQKVLASPDELKRKFAKSAEALKSRRRRQLFGHYGLLRNNAFLGGAFVLSSALQFFLIKAAAADLVAQAVQGGTDPLLAVLWMALAASVCSPIILVMALLGKLTLLPFSFANVLIMLLALRNIASLVTEWRTERHA